MYFIFLYFLNYWIYMFLFHMDKTGSGFVNRVAQMIKQSRSNKNINTCTFLRILFYKIFRF